MSGPRPRRTVPIAAILALPLLALAASAGAQATAAAPRPNWEPGWHVVRPGDTLEALARRFLGSSAFWQELHRLNPDIDDPDLINPGRRIRIWIARPSAEPNAQVEQVAGKVEERPAPVPWRPAARG
ncbi:MAG TPA: LysM domain-containing protein, partial [Thermoanaerobaculia bacterium]|nr:LysM domain-containing protein [Thermoanaerobaculia bacterium]